MPELDALLGALCDSIAAALPQPQQQPQRQQQAGAATRAAPPPPGRQLVCGVLPREEEEQAAPAQVADFSGAWPPHTGRYTQSQQAVFFAGFTYSIELSLSLSVRRALASSRDACAQLAGAVWDAWHDHLHEQNRHDFALPRAHALGGC